MNSQTVTVNLVPGLSTPAVVRISQYDYGRPILFKVMDGTMPASFVSGTVATVVGTKPSGLGFSEVAVISGNTASLDSTLAMTQECGMIPAEIRFSIQNGPDIGTANFILAVEPSPHPEGTTDGTQETMASLETRLQGQIDALDTRVGTLSDLTTSTQTDLVSAINEVDANTDTNTSAIGTLSNLTTTAKTNLVSAVNEVDADISDVKEDLNGLNDFLRTNRYDTRLAGDTEIIDGYYTSSNRTDGNYGKYRSTKNLIPLQDLNVVIDGTLSSHPTFTIQTYDENGTFLRGRLNNTAITSNNFIIKESDIIGTFTELGMAYVRLNFLDYDSSTSTFTRIDNAIDIYPFPDNKNVADVVETLSQDVTLLMDNSTEDRVLQFSNLSLYASGQYMKADGTLGSASAHGVVSFTTTVNNFDLIFSIPQDTGVVLGVVKNASDEVVATLDRQYTYYNADVCRSVDLTDGTYTVYLNWFNMNRANDYYDSVIMRTEADAQDVFNNNLRKQYFHSVRKPFDFYGKTAVFIGDSITRGATSGSTTIDSIYPSLFCQKVGMTYTNVAVSGAGFTKSDSTYQIMTQLQNAVKNTDYVFIAAGVNDYLDGADMATFKTAVQSAITYALANFSGEIIFITPINTAQASVNRYGFKVYLADYCNAITELAMKNNIDMRISIVQGWMFGFPTEDSNTEMITAMFGDTLHPTELGYKSLYVSGLLNALC